MVKKSSTAVLTSSAVKKLYFVSTYIFRIELIIDNHYSVSPIYRYTGLHKLCHHTIRDGSTWSKFGARGEHGVVFLFSNLGVLWFSENRALCSCLNKYIHCMFVSGNERTVFFPSDTLIYGISRGCCRNFNIRTCEHMILGQLIMGARKMHPWPRPNLPRSHGGRHNFQQLLDIRTSHRWRCPRSQLGGPPSPMVLCFRSIRCGKLPDRKMLQFKI